MTMIKTLGASYIVLSTMHALLFTLIILVYGAKGVNLIDSRELLPILGAAGGRIFYAMLVASVLGVVAGIGLLGNGRWARRLALILAVPNLFVIPFGTALGVFCVWTLWRSRNA